MSVRSSVKFIFTPEFKKWKNIVFLDSDIIVIAPVKDLAEVNGFYAVHDLFPTIKDQFREDQDSAWYEELKKNYSLKEKTFNSGVMAFNTELITGKTFEELKWLARKYPIVSYLGEQVFINLLFYKQWNKLPIAYNFNPFLLKHPFLTKKDPKIKGVVLHYPGSRKPWNERYSYYYRIWKENLDKADLINIKNPVSPKVNYSKAEIEKISKDINRRLFLHSPINYLDKIVGLIGIYLKEKTPKIYSRLKNFQLKLFKIQEE